MRRLFKKGERVRSKTSGKVMEVLRYLKNNLLQVKLFDQEKKEVLIDTVKEKELSKAA
jgi:ribosomal 30S subunit maturation factor RimM